MAVQTAPPKIKPKKSSAATNEALTAYLFIAPYLIVALVFLVGLMAYAFGISFTDQQGAIDKKFGFIGIDNYLRAFKDRQFLTTLANVFWYALIVTTLQTIGAVLVATLLNTNCGSNNCFAPCFTRPALPRRL